MAVKQPWAVRQFRAATAPSWTVPIGESWRVRRIVSSTVSSGYLQVLIDRTSVGYWRIDSGTLGNHLFQLQVGVERLNLFGLLVDQGIHPGYPVAEGQTLTLRTVPSGTITGWIEYEVRDAGDIRSDMPCGSDSDEVVIVNYGRPGSDVSSAAETRYTVSILPAEFPDFPFGQPVPGGYEAEIIGLAASERSTTSASSASNYIVTTGYKVMRGREVLFDRDRSPILALGYPSSNTGTTLIGNNFAVVGEYSDKSLKPPLILPEPVLFGPGEECIITVTTELGGSGATITAANLEIGVIERIRRAGGV
jgi:hypothetical protein